MAEIPPPPVIPTTGEYVVPVCFDAPEQVAELVAALDLWRILRGSGEISETFLRVLDALENIRAGCETCDDVPPPLPPLPPVIIKKKKLKTRWGELEITDKGLDIWDCGQDVVINICTPCDPVAVIPHQAKQPDLPLSVGAPYVPPVTPPAPTVARFDEARFDEAKFV